MDNAGAAEPNGRDTRRDDEGVAEREGFTGTFNLAAEEDAGSESRCADADDASGMEASDDIDTDADSGNAPLDASNDGDDDCAVALLCDKGNDGRAKAASICGAGNDGRANVASISDVGNDGNAECDSAAAMDERNCDVANANSILCAVRSAAAVAA